MVGDVVPIEIVSYKGSHISIGDHTFINYGASITAHQKVSIGRHGPVAELVGIEVGVVSGVMNLESSGVEASDWRPRHEEVYHDA
jgi:acetyltransferase-like isoleucine patch superfamily enzyme